MKRQTSETEVRDTIRKYVALSKIEIINSDVDLLEQETRGPEKSEVDAVRSWLCEHAVNPNRLRVALIDYAPEISLGHMSEPDQFIYDIMSGNVIYERRTVSDRVALDMRDMVVETMFEIQRMKNEFKQNGNNGSVPLKWYLSCEFLCANTKNSPYMSGDEHFSMSVGNDILSRSWTFASQGGFSPSDRISLWLHMNPRYLFTTEEGVSEWDSLKAQLPIYSCRRKKIPSVKPATDDEIRTVLETLVSDKECLNDISTEYDSFRVRRISTGKRINKRIYGQVVTKIGKSYDWLRKHVKNFDQIHNTLNEYNDEIVLGDCDWIVDHLMMIIKGETIYKRRNADDASVLANREEISDSLSAFYRIEENKKSGKEILSFPIEERRLRVVLIRYAKNGYWENGLVYPLSFCFGLQRLISVNEHSEPAPSNLELWLAMYPRFLFTTDKGRLERDRLNEQFICEQKALWRLMTAP